MDPNLNPHQGEKSDQDPHQINIRATGSATIKYQNQDPNQGDKSNPVPEFIDPVFTKTSPKRSFSLNRKRAFWLVFAKTGSIISGTDLHQHDADYVIKVLLG